MLKAITVILAGSLFGAFGSTVLDEAPKVKEEIKESFSELERSLPDQYSFILFLQDN